ncbi:MAG TPA: hypothetical protein VFC31_12910 [Candidatus Limnocylindria bacterium]|nr:hypothetical protein [Candidatus Limnocylindria bacterium]
MNDTDACELAFRLYLRNVETAKIAQALAREHGYKVETAEVERWVAERLEGQDPQRAKTVSAITEANRELWAAAASPGVAPAAKAGYLQAIARNEERLLRIAGPEGERGGPARYAAAAHEGRCGARGRGKQAGLFCDEPPAPGRRRCRVHGGASPIGAAHPRTTHGLYARGGASDILAAPFADEERRLIDRWRREPEEALRLQLAEGALMQRRAMRASAVELYTRLGTMIAATARALVALREVPPPEKGLPKLVEVFEGRTPADFERDLELIRREAQVAA